jgi:hypothetical protein
MKLMFIVEENNNTIFFTNTYHYTPTHTPPNCLPLPAPTYAPYAPKHTRVLKAAAM